MTHSVLQFLHIDNLTVIYVRTASLVKVKLSCYCGTILNKALIRL